MLSNPFHDLYLSEAISEDDLVRFFSPIIVEHSGVVFEPGNVIIRGLQGTGKTMLLNLLRPQLRLAYRRANVPFPVPPRAANFIGAGINLRKCGILEFAQLLDKDISQKDFQELSLFFADFFNYWIVFDLIESITVLIESNDVELYKSIGLNIDALGLDDFAKILACDDCWFGALVGVETLVELKTKILERISTYRRYINLNIDDLPKSIVETKTVVGDPILKTVDALRNAKVIEDKTKIFVRIDQYEQLTTLNVVGTQYGTVCQELIHKALGARDGRVSYRIGTRTHGWDERPAIYRTNDVLERKRDFDIHDMDEIFRRRENSATWWFPEFAQDIFIRRIRSSEYSSEQVTPPMNIVLGKSLLSGERANTYVSSPESRRRLIDSAVESLPPETPVKWIEYIKNLADPDVLSAWLSCAWVRQKVTTKKAASLNVLPPLEGLPWASKPYWHKERVQIGLMQLASANRQAPMWSGDKDVLSLSDGQILLFLFILQHIWDAWLRDRRGEDPTEFAFPIRQEVQSQGVREASSEWRSKQSEGPNAFKRRMFVDTLGEYLYVSLTNDKAMSNPGANGFSIENGELAESSDVRDFLMDAVSYGDLVQADHTSKKKGERRTKYYLTPILSPYFRIPSVHTKEPKYISVKDVRMWLEGNSSLSQKKESVRKNTIIEPKLQPEKKQQSLWDE